MEILTFPGKPESHDIVKALRNIADDIEAGRYDFEPTIGALVLGHETVRRDLDGELYNFGWETHGLGGIGVFETRGLLASAASKFGPGND